MQFRFYRNSVRRTCRFCGCEFDTTVRNAKCCGKVECVAKREALLKIARRRNASAFRKAAKVRKASGLVRKLREG